LRRPHLLRFSGDGGTAFLVPNAFVENLPNQTTQPVGDCADRLGVSEGQDNVSGFRPVTTQRLARRHAYRGRGVRVAGRIAAG
jgi:hypothetical protein